METEPRPGEGSLLDSEIASAVAAGSRPAGLRDRLRAFERRCGAGLAGAWSRPASRYAIMGVSSVGAVALGLSIYMAIRPVPKPDYETAQIARLFDYTLLTDEFNRLPVEERVELISQLYQRVRSMDASESAMMASFFAGVAGEARDQIEENASKLMLDAADMVAKDYAAVPEEDKEAYLESALVRLVRLTEPFDGSISEATDEEIITEAKENAARDYENMQEGEMTAQQASQFMVFMGQRVDRNSSSHQRQRINLFMRDLTRHLRSGG